MTIPVSETERLLDPREEGISQEEAERRRVAAKQSLLALINSWIAEGENATEEERRAAAEEWRDFFENFEPFQLREYRHEP
jgi:hypothetical protein